MLREDLIKQLVSMGENPKATMLDESEKTGKHLFGCFPPHSPDELVYAAGFIPIGMWGGCKEFKLADKYLQSFACSIVRSNLEFGMSGVYDNLDGVIIPLLCDHLKCVSDDWSVAVKIPTIKLAYAQNRKGESGKRYMACEFKDVLGKLEKITKVKITEEDILDACRIYDEWRKEMQRFVALAAKHSNTISNYKRHYIIKASYFSDKKNHTQLIKSLNNILTKMPEEEAKGPKIVLTGVMMDAPELLQAFDELGLVIVADDLGQESRQYRNLNGENGDACYRMADRISRQDGDSFFHDVNKTRGSMLIQMVKNTEAEGIIFNQMSFCDAEEFDYPIMKKEFENAKIPVLFFESNQYVESAEQIKTRLQGFKEMIY